MIAWKKVADCLPLCGLVVETKIDDHDGCRNEQQLKRGCSDGAAYRLWFFPDGRQYVYYTPTHWREVEDLT